MTQAQQPEALHLADRLEEFALSLPAYGFDDRLPKESAAELRRLHVRELELQDKLEMAHQSSGAEAYEIACEEMEYFQRERAAAGKEVGTTHSLVEGMAWVYGRIDELEACAPLTVDVLEDWRRRVNTVAACTVKADRYKAGSALKQDIADAIERANGITGLTP